VRPERGGPSAFGTATAGDSCVLAALGQPTDTRDAASSTFGPGAEVLVFESGGYAYGALVVDDLVLGLPSGDPAWVGEPEGCPT
jgi:hypothetical protein